MRVHPSLSLQSLVFFTSSESFALLKSLGGSSRCFVCKEGAFLALQKKREKKPGPANSINMPHMAFSYISIPGQADSLNLEFFT